MPDWLTADITSLLTLAGVILAVALEPGRVFRRFGLYVMAFGFLLNLAVIFANDASMPVWRPAKEAIGGVSAPLYSFANHFYYDDFREAKLAVLSDCLPYRIGGIERSVASPGDVLVFLGGASYLPILAWREILHRRSGSS